MASFGELIPFVDSTYKYFKEITMDKTNFPYVFQTPEYWTDEHLNWETQDKSKDKRISIRSFGKIYMNEKTRGNPQVMHFDNGSPMKSFRS